MNHIMMIRDGNRRRYVPASPAQIMDAARRAADEACPVGTPMSNPKTVADYLTAKLAGLEHEVFGVLYLDNRHRLLAYEELFRGTIDGASVYPREVVKAALRHNAAAVIFTHNHPSGDPEPSGADKSITKRLRDALALVDMRVLDHVIVAGGKTLSFAAWGLI